MQPFLEQVRVYDRQLRTDLTPAAVPRTSATRFREDYQHLLRETSVGLLHASAAFLDGYGPQYGDLVNGVLVAARKVLEVGISALCVHSGIHIRAAGQPRPTLASLHQQLTARNILTDITSECASRIRYRGNCAAHPVRPHDAHLSVRDTLADTCLFLGWLYERIPNLGGGQEIMIARVNVPSGPVLPAPTEQANELEPEPEPIPPTSTMLGALALTFHVNPNWTVVAGLSGQRILFYNKVNSLFEIFRTLPEGSLGERLQSHTHYPGWDTIVELPNSKLLFYDNGLARAAAYELQPDGSLGAEIYSHTGLWHRWDVITCLPGNLQLFFRNSDHRVEIYRIREDGHLGCFVLGHNNWWTWDLILPVPASRIMFYSREATLAEVYDWQAEDGTLGQRVEQNDTWFDWSTITIVGGDKIAFYRRASGKMEIYQLTT